MNRLIHLLLMMLVATPALAADHPWWHPKRYFSSAAKTPASTPIREAISSQGALLETERGNIVIELYPDQAPKTVENFTRLVKDGFYNKPGMKFHRVVPGFVVQTGDPSGTGYGGSDKTIPLEVNNRLSHNIQGMVAMARGRDINSATSQFYITLASQTYLDGKYAIFGKVVQGLDVLGQIQLNDKLYGVQLVELAPKKTGQSSRLHW
jgi:cyclophilin family peptidyl-prolyl cis-trans isomerase